MGKSKPDGLLPEERRLLKGAIRRITTAPADSLRYEKALADAVAVLAVVNERMGHSLIKFKSEPSLLTRRAKLSEEDLRRHERIKRSVGRLRGKIRTAPAREAKRARAAALRTMGQKFRKKYPNGTGGEFATWLLKPENHWRASRDSLPVPLIDGDTPSKSLYRYLPRKIKVSR